MIKLISKHSTDSKLSEADKEIKLKMIYKEQRIGIESDILYRAINNLKDFKNVDESTKEICSIGICLAIELATNEAIRILATNNGSYSQIMAVKNAGFGLLFDLNQFSWEHYPSSYIPKEDRLDNGYWFDKTNNAIRLEVLENYINYINSSIKLKQV